MAGDPRRARRHRLTGAGWTAVAGAYYSSPKTPPRIAPRPGSGRLRDRPLRREADGERELCAFFWDRVDCEAI